MSITRVKPYQIATRAIQSGLVRESKKVLPLSNFTKKPLAVSFASYNLCGFYFSSINHCQHFLAEDLSKIINPIRNMSDSGERKEDDIDASGMDPQIIGSLYSVHLKNYQSYFIAWLTAERLFHNQNSVKSKADVDMVFNSVSKEFTEKKDKLINTLKNIKSSDIHAKNAKLFDILISSLDKSINEDEIRKNDLLKFIFSKTTETDIVKEINFGFEKRKLLERWHIWYKRQPAILEMLEHVTQNMGINIINFQEGNAESLHQINAHLKNKKINYSIIAFSDQTGEEISNPELVAEEGFKAKDGLGFSNAVMYDTNRYELVISKQYWISNTPEIPSSTPGGIPHHKNSLTMAIFIDKIHQVTFAVFNTHITPVPAGHEFSRKKIVEIVNNAVKEHKNIPFILSGDFNTYPDITEEADHYESYRKETNADDWRDLFAESICTSPLIDPATFNGLGNDPEKNRIDEKSESLNPKVLDHVYLNGFEKFGNAFKLIFPVNVNEKQHTCDLDLKSELDKDTSKLAEAVRKYRTASDHLMIGIQSLFSTKKIAVKSVSEVADEKSLPEARSTVSLGYAATN